MKEDYKKIKRLIEMNEFFYKNKLILNNEYAKNSLLFADKLDKILGDDQRITLVNYLHDDKCLIKFNLSISILKAVPN